MPKRKLTRDKVVSIVNGKQLVGVCWADTGGSDILFECSPEKADKIIEIFNDKEMTKQEAVKTVVELTSRYRITLPDILDGYKKAKNP